MKPEKRIMRLTSKLPDRLHLAKAMEYNVVNCEYDAHHCSQVVISDSIAEFQVMRYFDIEIEPYQAEDYAYDYLLTPQEKAFVDKLSESEDEEPWEFWDEYWNNHDIMGCSYKFDTGEYMQKWINLKTGQITILGKVCKNKRKYCDWNRRKWEVITPRMKFYKYFIEGLEETGFYLDNTVNPLLKKHGYTGINAFNWTYNCGEEENLSAEAKFYKSQDWSKFLISMANGTNPLETALKIYGTDELFYAENLQEPCRSEYKSALRICRRNNYTPKDKSLWRDMVKTLFKLGKDLHNAFYVCPDNLNEAHDKWVAKLAAIQEKEKLQRAIQEMNKDKIAKQTFEEQIKKFAKLKLIQDNIVIRPLMTIEEFAEEGKAMHHCVFVNKYYTHADSLILSARNANNNHRLATIEIDLHNFSIVQCRAECNNVSEYDTQIRNVINNNWKLIKKLSLAKTKKQKAV